MITVSATKLRQNLFTYLDRTAAGEIVVIKRNSQEVARLIPTGKADWRESMEFMPELLVSPEELIQPMDDVWEDYI